MTFHAEPSTAGVVATVAVLAATVLAWGEWRRPDGRCRPLRLGATLLAVLGLALFGLRPTWRGDRPARPRHGFEATLYTPTLAAPGATLPATGLRFALPATHDASHDAVVLPDVAALRRRFPQVGVLHVYGDGLEPFDLDTLRGLRVIFDPPAPTGTARPAITFLHCPRELPLGAPLDVEGRVDGLPPGESAVLTLIAPDGSTTNAATSPAGRDGGAAFTVRSPAPPAAGRFDWRLRLARGHDTLSDDPLGVAVTRPTLPRVLVLESTPRFDTAALRRWFEQAGGTLAARTQVGKDLYRYFGPAGAGDHAPKEFASLDGPFLAGFDLVLADGRSLLALKEPELAALHTAVTDTGLGMLTLADDVVLPSAPAAESAAAKSLAAPLLPWTLRPVSGGEPTPETADRSIRLRWPGMELPLNTPVEAAPWEIDLHPAQSAVVRDDQGRAVAAAAPLGRGQLALTVVRETGRWNRANDPAAFAAYWSHLFSRVARSDATGGRWLLAGGEAGPMRVDEPLELVWQEASGTPPAPARIIDETGEAASLPFIGDPAEPGRWRGTFWPRRAGWHRAAVPGSAPFDFRVEAPGVWPALAAAHRRMATARFAAASSDNETVGMMVPPAAPVPIAPGWWFGMFLLGAGTLWVERRLAAGGSTRPPGGPGAAGV